MTTHTREASNSQHNYELPTLIITIDPSLENIEISKLSPDRIAEVLHIINNLRFSDSYYLGISKRYNSQALKYAVNENQPARVLNDMVRKLTGAYPNLDEALSNLATNNS